MALELFQWFIIGFLLILPILYELSSTFRYHAKFALYYSCILGIASVVCVYSVFRPGDVRNHWFIMVGMGYVKKLFAIDVEVRNKHHLDSDKPYILILNHQSSLDCIGMFEIFPERGCTLIKRELMYAGPFGLAAALCGSVFIDRYNPSKAVETMNHTVEKIHEQNLLHYFPPGMASVWPDRCACLVKKELMYAGPFGLAALLCGSVFVDRFNSEKAVETMKKTVHQINSKNLKLMVFPEGTRNHDGSMMPFKKGAFHLAVQAQIPVVPAVFSSFAEFYSKRDKKFSTGKFIITCLPPISTRGLKPEDVNDLTENCRKVMLDTFNQSSLEATQNKLASKITNGNSK